MKISTLLVVGALPLLAVLSAAAQGTTDHVVQEEGTVRQEAIFAGGCFWCMEKPFEEVDGVLEVQSGYTAGTDKAPTYETYAAGGHIEAVKIFFDPRRVSYRQLLDIFWRQIDPTDEDGQFVDRGRAYSTAIFYLDEEQRAEAEQSKSELAARRVFSKPLVTPVLPAEKFYPAEEYHQDYYRKNPLRYRIYRSGSGRDRFLEKIWQGKEKDAGPDRASLRQKLSPLQYHVTQEEGTEPAFANEYWNNKRPGIYVDIVSGAPLFSSTDKFDSGTGWPSFNKPLVKENIVERKDRRLFVVRTEVRSKKAGSHLGHVFTDGPEPTGLRYCINSAALRFIPVDRLDQEGYGEFLPLFEEQRR